MGIPRIAGTVAELLGQVDARDEVHPADARSGSIFEHVRIGPERYFLKCVSRSGDWIMRVTGDDVYRTFAIWRAGVMDAVPDCIDHAVVGMALEGSGDDAVLGIVMRDVGEHLVPPGDGMLSVEQSLRFIDHLAALSARFWGWQDRIGLITMPQRFRFFAPQTLVPELARPDTDVTITVAAHGWDRLAELAPREHALLTEVHRRPEPLVAALAATPATFLQGDWKLGNLGSHPDGRTILLDWAMPGSGPACWDLAWFLALNRVRLPVPRADMIEEFRSALHRYAVVTEGWFDRQLQLCLFAMAVTMGWEKALDGEGEELAWWLEQADRGARLLTDRP